MPPKKKTPQPQLSPSRTAVIDKTKKTTKGGALGSLGQPKSKQTSKNTVDMLGAFAEDNGGANKSGFV
jgi:hypothetical protein